MKHNTRVYVDFMKTDSEGRLRLVCLGTKNDLEKLGIVLVEGMTLNVYSDDANERGDRDDLLAEGVVLYNKAEEEWVLSLDPASIRHESDP